MSSDPFQEYFASFPPEQTAEERGSFPFRVRCCVVKRRPARHEGFEYIRDFGMPHIGKVFENQPFPEGMTDLVFIFPERWMGVAEQQGFVHALARHHQAKQIKCVSMLTSSPLIVGNFLRDQVRVLTFEDDDKYCGEIEARHAASPMMRSFVG